MTSLILSQVLGVMRNKPIVKRSVLGAERTVFYTLRPTLNALHWAISIPIRVIVHYLSAS